MPYGTGRAFASSGSGLLVTGMGCITYSSATDQNNTGGSSLTIYDGWGANGQPLIDYTLTQNESTSEILGLHWLQFTEGLYVNIASGSVVGTITAWLDHDCGAYNAAQYITAQVNELDLAARLARLIQ